MLHYKEIKDKSKNGYCESILLFSYYQCDNKHAYGSSGEGTPNSPKGNARQLGVGPQQFSAGHNKNT